MNSGLYKNRVTIQKLKNDPPKDEHGEVDLTDDLNWETYEKRWVQIISKGGQEFWKVDRIESEVSHVLRTQYDSRTAGITSQMRIRMNSRTLNIAAVYDPNEAHKTIEMQCKEPV